MSAPNGKGPWAEANAANPDERTPLVGGSTASYTDVQDQYEEDDEIDPDDFDLLLSRSTSYTGGPLLRPESVENPLLRGDRKYSTNSRAGHPHGISSRRTSIASEAIDDDLASELDRARHGADAPFLNGLSYSRFWLIFSNVLALNFISNFDGTIMASSHPVITSYFHSSNSASWLSTAFLLTSTAFQPLLGSLSDSIGRKTPYMATMVIFALATLWCALAQSMTSFIAARAFCGLGAGGVMTLGSIIVSDLVPIERRGAYQSYINMVYGVASTSGAALGGFMADYLGWRWEFGIQVPALLLCVGVSAFTIPERLGLKANKKETVLEAMKHFDFMGSFFLMTSITFLILGLNLGGNVLPWSHPFVIASLVIFATFFPTFLWAESTATHPIMPLYLIQRSPHRNMIFSNSLAAFMMNAILFNMPLYFQAVLLTSATTSGLCLMGKLQGFPFSFRSPSYTNMKICSSHNSVKHLRYGYRVFDHVHKAFEVAAHPGHISLFPGDNCPVVDATWLALDYIPPLLGPAFHGPGLPVPGNVHGHPRGERAGGTGGRHEHTDSLAEYGNGSWNRGKQPYCPKLALGVSRSVCHRGGGQKFGRKGRGDREGQGER